MEDKRSPEDIPERAVCRVCGGPIRRGGYSARITGVGGWTHARREDWVDNVHQAEPRD